MPRATAAKPSSAPVEAQIAAFLAKYDPAVAKEAKAARRALRKAMPTAHELVYDNYNALAIGYAPDDRRAHGQSASERPRFAAREWARPNAHQVGIEDATPAASVLSWRRTGASTGRRKFVGGHATGSSVQGKSVCTSSSRCVI